MNTDEKLSLSELVGFRNRLNNIVTVDGVKNSIDDICTLIENTNVNSNTHKEQRSLYNDKFQSIKQQLDSVTEDVANHNKLISEELERVSKKFYAGGKNSGSANRSRIVMQFSLCSVFSLYRSPLQIRKVQTLI